MSYSLAMAPHLSITVRITTSSSIFDLAQQKPFSISLVPILDHTHPITFDPLVTPVFNGNILYKNGLTFTNIATGELVPRNTRNLCNTSSFSDHTMPFEEIMNSSVTLHPGREHVLHAALQPILSHDIFSTQGLTCQDIADKQTDLPKAWKWPNVAGMQDRQVYQVGVDKNIGVKAWMQGSVESLVETKRSDLRLPINTEVVQFKVVECARFETRRPDTDGSLDWP
jgi:hypothetical protein